MKTIEHLRVNAKFLPPDPSQADNGLRHMVITTNDRDRGGDIVDPIGCDYRAYMAGNPIVLWAHDYQGGASSGRINVIGRTHELTFEPDRIIATYEFAPTDFAQEAKALVDTGAVNGASIGFLSIENEPLDREHPWDGLRHTKWELLEWSVVPVPMNANATAIRALTQARVKSYGTDLSEWVRAAIRSSDTFSADPLGRALAGTTRKVRQISMVRP